MMRVRPIRFEDLEALEELAHASSGGITTLPTDRRLLHEKIEQSQFAFGKDVIRPKDESYLFALEEMESKACIGVSAIHSQLGEPEAVFAFHLAHIRQHSEYVPIDKKLKLLTPASISTGPSEVCTLFLHPDYRKEGLGSLLSLSRFLFMALFPTRFGKEVMALMRGYQTEGESPFWEGVMRPFFDMSFDAADAMRYQDGRFIADLAPKHPLYVPLLSQRARSAIGKAHPHTEPALKLLKRENFHFSRYVDLFDAGPYYSARLSEIRSAKIRQTATVMRITEKAIHSVPHLISNERADFRSCYAHIHLEEGGVALDANAAKALEVAKGETISYAHPYEESSDAF